MPRTELFPDIEPNRSGMLKVDAVHRVYWEESGRADGLPVLFLHGGPGAGCGAAHRQFFDPGRHRIILFDQRGAGRSTPLAEIRDNTTAHLVADIERLRRHLGVERWLVFGGSWGSTLALAYGQAHPERCCGFILRGVFLGRRSEINWFLDGMGLFFPEAHRRFLEHLPKAERSDPLSAYHARLVDEKAEVHMPAGLAWSAYESGCSALVPDGKEAERITDAGQALALARLEAHYFVNRCFLEDNQLLAGVGRIKHLPMVIVQGRYDVICPIATATALANAWPKARMVVIADAGHSATEKGIREALVAAVDGFAMAMS